MIHSDISTIIYRPVRQVFDFVSTPGNDFQWQYGTLATTSLSRASVKQGPFFEAFIGHLSGRRVQGTFEVTEYELDWKYGFKSLSGKVRTQTSYAFEMADGGTRINISTRAHMVDFSGWMSIFWGKRLKNN